MSPFSLRLFGDQRQYGDRCSPLRYFFLPPVKAGGLRCSPARVLLGGLALPARRDATTAAAATLRFVADFAPVPWIAFSMGRGRRFTPVLPQHRHDVFARSKAPGTITKLLRPQFHSPAM
jgi:hypothetical protein